jgi:hypothetical protein
MSRTRPLNVQCYFRREAASLSLENATMYLNIAKTEVLAKRGENVKRDTRERDLFQLRLYF